MAMNRSDTNMYRRCFQFSIFILHRREDFPWRRVSLGDQCTGKKGLGMFWGEKKNLKMRVLKTCMNRYHTNSIGLAMVHNSLEKHTLLITNACLPVCTISSVFLKHGKNFAVYGA